MELKLLQLAIQNLSDRYDKLEQDNKLLHLEIKELKRKQSFSEPNQTIKVSEEDELLNIKSAMDLLKVSRSGFIRMVSEGVFKPIKMNLRTLRYSKRQILEFIQRDS
jgi:predicted DNA-binding transcriptional regulator AlpA